MRVTGLFLSLALAGCGSTFRGAPPLPAPDVTAGNAQLASLHNAEAIVACVAGALDQQTACRDKIIQARLISIDAEYTTFRQAFYRDARWGGFAATIASMGLSGAAAVGGVPMTAARVMSAVSSGITGGREAFDKEILIQQTANAVERAMDSARTSVLTRIQTSMGKPATQYSLAIALSDLEAYYTAGTVLGGLIGVTEAVETQAKEVDNAKRLVLSGYNSSKAAIFLQKLVEAPGAEGTNNRRRIAAARKELNFVEIVGVGLWPYLPDSTQAEIIAVARKLGWNEN
jgi:hypothetical protein